MQWLGVPAGGHATCAVTLCPPPPLHQGLPSLHTLDPAPHGHTHLRVAAAQLLVAHGSCILEV